MSDAKQLQDLLDDPACARVDWRDRGESRGSFLVRRRVTLDAENSAIVGIDGPALVVEPGGHLTIRGGWISTFAMDLASKAVGVADGWRRGPCIDVKQGGSICFEGTDVIGDVLGASGLSGEWHLPLVLRLPDLPAWSRGVALIRGFVPCEVEVTSEIHSVGATVRAIGPGPVEIGIDIDARDTENGVLLDGWICFAAQGARRRTRIRARTSSTAPPLPKGAIWEAAAYATPPSLPVHSAPPPPPPRSTPTPTQGQPKDPSATHSPAVPPREGRERSALSPIFGRKDASGVGQGVVFPPKAGSANFPTEDAAIPPSVASPPGDSSASVPDPKKTARSLIGQLVAGRTEPSESRLSDIFRPKKPQSSPLPSETGSMPMDDVGAGDPVTTETLGAPGPATSPCAEASEPLDGRQSGAPADTRELSAGTSPGGDSPVAPPRPKTGGISPVFRRPSDKLGP